MHVERGARPIRTYVVMSRRKGPTSIERLIADDIEAMDLTQESLAETLHVTQASISKNGAAV